MDGAKQHELLKIPAKTILLPRVLHVADIRAQASVTLVKHIALRREVRKVKNKRQQRQQNPECPILYLSIAYCQFQPETSLQRKTGN